MTRKLFSAVAVLAVSMLLLSACGDTGKALSDAANIDVDEVRTKAAEQAARLHWRLE